MSNKVTLFYRREKAFHLSFDYDAISSDGGLILLDRIENKTKCIKSFGLVILDMKIPNTFVKKIFTFCFMNLAKPARTCQNKSGG